MAERAGLFETEDFDVSTFTTKKTVNASEPRPEAVREVSEAANFQSREPIHTAAPKASAKSKVQRRRRTGRNLQLNLKVAAKTLESFYEIADRQGWVLGETLERAVGALQRELAGQT